MLKGKVYYETKGSNIENVLEQYKMSLASSTAFLFIVMKGRFSEGINFTAELCRCLVVVGIPFLPLKDPAIVEKMKYLEATGTKEQA
jgi:chromosome transmission fidelity protein 1